MTVVKTILKKTHNEVVAKVAGADASATISLTNDMIPYSSQVGRGTISVSSSLATIVGTGTNFTTFTGSTVLLYKPDGTLIGTLLSVTDNRHATLTSNSAVTYNGAFTISYPIQTVSSPTVNIIGMSWTGAANAIAQITRNSVIITTLQANSAGTLEFTGQDMLPENINNSYDIVVTMTGQAELWIRLRKESGFSSTIETASYSIYDDPMIVGS